MILFQDSDRICKRYLRDETGVQETLNAIESAQLLAASSVSNVEVRGVLTRARRAHRIRTARQYERITSEFETDWLAYYRVHVSDRIINDAGDIASKYGLTGLDAIQLATALEVQRVVADELLVSAWDVRSGLVAAIQAEGLKLAH